MGWGCNSLTLTSVVCIRTVHSLLLSNRHLLPATLCYCLTQLFQRSSLLTLIAHTYNWLLAINRSIDTGEAECYMLHRLLTASPVLPVLDHHLSLPVLSLQLDYPGRYSHWHWDTQQY